MYSYSFFESKVKRHQMTVVQGTKKYMFTVFSIFTFLIFFINVSKWFINILLMTHRITNYVLLDILIANLISTLFRISSAVRYEVNVVIDIHLPRDVSSFLRALLRARPFLCLLLALSFPSQSSVSLAPFCTVCRLGIRHTSSIVLILSYVGVAIVSSLRSSAIPIDCDAYIQCVAAWEKRRRAVRM